MSPSLPTYTHPQTPRNIGAIPKTGKGKDFQLFPPNQDPPNRQTIPHKLDKYVSNQVENQSQVINLSSKALSGAELEVLSLDLSFCPTASIDSFEIVKDLDLFARHLTYKYMFDDERKKKKQEILEHEQWKGFTVRDFMALKDLMDHLDENDGSLGGSAEEGPPTCTGVSPQATPPQGDS